MAPCEAPSTVGDALSIPTSQLQGLIVTPEIPARSLKSQQGPKKGDLLQNQHFGAVCCSVERLSLLRGG